MRLSDSKCAGIWNQVWARAGQAELDSFHLFLISVFHNLAWNAGSCILNLHFSVEFKWTRQKSESLLRLYSTGRPHPPDKKALTLCQALHKALSSHGEQS